MRQILIPRLELAAALFAVKMNRMLKKELNYRDMEDHYWTNSKVILGYISNDARRFHIFVANRVQQIRDQNEIEQWNYVSTRDNPADNVSREISASALVNNSSWFNGQEFLWSKPWQEYVQKFPL